MSTTTEQTINHDQPLTESEVQRLVMALAHAKHPESFTEDEAHAVIEWAEGLRMELGALSAVLHGDLTVRPGENGEMLFSISEQGERRVKAMGAPATPEAP